MLQSLQDLLGMELWRTDRHGSTSLGYFLLLVLICCALTWFESSRKKRASQHEASRVSGLGLPPLVSASATYYDSHHVQRKVSATIERIFDTKHVLRLTEVIGEDTEVSEFNFSKFTDLVVYLETKTILRVGDFRVVE